MITRHGRGERYCSGISSWPQSKLNLPLFSPVVLPRSSPQTHTPLDYLLLSKYLSKYSRLSTQHSSTASDNLDLIQSKTCETDHHAKIRGYEYLQTLPPLLVGQSSPKGQRGRHSHYLPSALSQLRGPRRRQRYFLVLFPLVSHSELHDVWHQHQMPATHCMPKD